MATNRRVFFAQIKLEGIECHRLKILLEYGNNVPYVLMYQERGNYLQNPYYKGYFIDMIYISNLAGHELITVLTSTLSEDTL